MPEKAKRILISTETYDRVTFTFGGCCAMRGFCEFCGGETSIISVEAASAVTGKRTDAILRLIESSELHCLESGHGQVMICETSLNEFMR
ncbi:MAG TPA: hypothetical protein DEP46_16490 [Blastocatellia bacterium]|nr:hypothetical protein [Blastocatellia bacterium]